MIERRVDEEYGASAPHSVHVEAQDPALTSSEDIIDRAVESAVVREVFGHNEFSRRSFLSMIGAGTAAAALSTVFPMEEAKAAMKETMGLGKLEKKNSISVSCRLPVRRRYHGASDGLL